MLDARRRWVLFYDFTLQPKPEDAPIPAMVNVLESLKQRVENGDCIKLMANETEQLRISHVDIRTRDDAAVLLAHFSSKNIADPAFRHFFTNAVRVERKQTNEGISFSAHIVVALSPDDERSPEHLMLLEDVPGVGKSRLEPFFTSEFKMSLPYNFKNEDGELKSARVLAKLDGHASQTLKDELELGQLKGIELINTTWDENEMDETGTLKTDSYTLRLRVQRVKKGLNLMDIVKSVGAKARDRGFDKMKIRYNMTHGKQRTVDVSVHREDIGEAMFTRMEEMALATSADQSITTINEEIASGMVRMLRSERASRRQ